MGHPDTPPSARRRVRSTWCSGRAAACVRAASARWGASRARSSGGCPCATRPRPIERSSPAPSTGSPLRDRRRPAPRADRRGGHPARARPPGLVRRRAPRRTPRPGRPPGVDHRLGGAPGRGQPLDDVGLPRPQRRRPRERARRLLRPRHRGGALRHRRHAGPARAPGYDPGVRARRPAPRPHGCGHGVDGVGGREPDGGTDDRASPARRGQVPSGRQLVLRQRRRDPRSSSRPSSPPPAPPARRCASSRACAAFTDEEGASRLGRLPGVGLEPAEVRRVLDAPRPVEAGIRRTVEEARSLLSIDGVDGVDLSGPGSTGAPPTAWRSCGRSPNASASSRRSSMPPLDPGHQNEFGTVASWTAEELASLDAASLIAGACRGSASPASAGLAGRMPRPAGRPPPARRRRRPRRAGRVGRRALRGRAHDHRADARGVEGREPALRAPRGGGVGHPPPPPHRVDRFRMGARRARHAARAPPGPVRGPARAPVGRAARPPGLRGHGTARPRPGAVGEPLPVDRRAAGRRRRVGVRGDRPGGRLLTPAGAARLEGPPDRVQSRLATAHGDDPATTTPPSRPAVPRRCSTPATSGPCSCTSSASGTRRPPHVRDVGPRRSRRPRPRRTFPSRTSTPSPRSRADSSARSRAPAARRRSRPATSGTSASVVDSTRPTSRACVG